MEPIICPFCGRESENRNGIRGCWHGGNAGAWIAPPNDPDGSKAREQIAEAKARNVKQWLGDLFPDPANLFRDAQPAEMFMPPISAKPETCGKCELRMMATFEALKAEREGMVWENVSRQHRGLAIAYDDVAFNALAEQFNKVFNPACPAGVAKENT